MEDRESPCRNEAAHGSTKGFRIAPEALVSGPRVVRVTGGIVGGAGHEQKSTGFEWRPPTVFVGVVLLIGWAVCLRLTLRSIGSFGLLLANAFLAALYWLVASWGWLPIENVAAISWLGLFSVAAILAVGMSWSHWRRGRAVPPG
jgi:hypothetical protein